MKIKTSDLTGTSLDWAVAMCKGYDMSKAICFHDRDGVYGLEKDKMLRYSTDWAQGGAIIESEQISIDYDQDVWNASTADTPAYYQGATALEAAMRCYVASKLGGSIEVPEELV